MRRAEDAAEEPEDPEEAAISKGGLRRPPIRSFCTKRKLVEMQTAVKWEYMFLKADAPTASVEQLNVFGARGWLLVSVYPLGESVIYVFARDLSSDGDGDSGVDGE